MSVFTFNALSSAMRKSADRGRDIRAARDKKRQDDEEYDADMKIKNLKIDSMERSGEMDKMVANSIREEFKAKDKVHKAKSEYSDLMISGEEQKNDKGAKSLQRTGNKMAQSLMRGQLEPSYSSKSGFSIKPKKSSTTVKPTDKVLGTLKSGGVYRPYYGVQKFADRSDAEAYASQSLGPDWQSNFPEAVKIIDEKFGKSGDKYKIGEIKSVQGKGQYEYVGNGKWKKAK